MADFQTPAQEAILRKIADLAPSASAENLKSLAEAYAWVIVPNNGH